MKRIVLAWLAVCLLLAGCMHTTGLDRAMELRAQLLSGVCSFDAVITADFPDRVATFTMHCEADSGGAVHFTVLEPASIAGISGQILESGGELNFDDQALEFGLLADGRANPISGPWLLMKTLRDGYLTAATEDSGGYRVTIDDSYADDALTLDIWVDGENLPQAAEVSWEGSRILTMELQNFRIG